MPRPPAKNPRLNDRDYDIFEHILRYRLTTREVLHKLFFNDSEENAVTKVTSRLTEHGFLNRHDLYPPRTYFVLGPKAGRIMGVSPKKTRELGPQALIREYAMLIYCCMVPDAVPPHPLTPQTDTPAPSDITKQRRGRLTVAELSTGFPSLLQRKLDSSHYYVDRVGDTTRLNYLRVDYGGPPEHLVRKARQDIQARLPHPAFRQLMDSGRFLLTILTGRKEKQAAIEQSLKDHEWPVEIRVDVLADLVELIARFQGGT